MQKGSEIEFSSLPKKFDSCADLLLILTPAIVNYFTFSLAACFPFAEYWKKCGEFLPFLFDWEYYVRNDCFLKT